MPRRRPDGGVATPRWVVALAVGVSVAVHVALIWGNFAIYRIDIVPKKGERYLMVGQLVKGLPDQIPIPAAPARVPVSSAPAPRSVDAPSSTQAPPTESLSPSEAREAERAMDPGVPTPTPQVLSWDMASGRQQGRNAVPNVRLGGAAKDGVPILEYRGVTSRPPVSAPVPAEAPRVAVPRRELPAVTAPKVPEAVPRGALKAPRTPKNWAVTIDSFLHEELSRSRRPPKLTYIEDIPFPEQARREGIEDHILVEVRVGPDGKASSWRFARGKTIFRGNVEKALRGAEFEPARDDEGRKVEGDLTLDIHFFLQEQR